MRVCENIPPLLWGGTPQTIATQGRLELNSTQNELRYDVSKYELVTIQFKAETTWATAVITVYRSLDGVTAFALETPVTVGPGTGTPAAAMTPEIDVSSVSHLIVRVTTVEGSSLYVGVIMKGSRVE